MNHVSSFVKQLIIPEGLTHEQLKRLGDHKYSAQDVSFLDEFCMKRFWEWCVGKYPLWVAPNLITLIGLAFNVCAVVILTLYSPDGIQVAPRLVYLFCAISLFIYQTLDATDGKQARRTGSATPLGELFDHGCDSLSQVFITLETTLSLQLGMYPTVFMIVLVMSLFLFYLAHWQTYVCGTLCFTKFDVTEAQMCVIAVCLITFLVGPEFWQISLLGYPLSLYCALIGVCLFGMQSMSYFRTIFTGGVGKNGSTVAGTSVLYPIFPISIPLAMCITIYARSEGVAFQEHIVLYSILFGLVCSKITNTLVIAHMSKSPMTTWDNILLGPFVLFFNQYWNSFFPEYLLLWLAVVICSLNYLIYSTVIVEQLCGYLRIECFRIAPNKSQ